MLSTYTNSCALVNCKYRVLPKCPVRYHGMAPYLLETIATEKDGRSFMDLAELQAQVTSQSDFFQSRGKVSLKHILVHFLQTYDISVISCEPKQKEIFSFYKLKNSNNLTPVSKPNE